MSKLLDIRFLLEREVKDQIGNEDIINWCNQVNMDVGVSINVPSATPSTIVLDVTKLSYTLPVDLKLINRIRLKSDLDNGIDKPSKINYRIYNGQLIIPKVFWAATESLIVDYFKHMKYFSDITDEIDIDDRFTPLYTFFCKLKYHNEIKDSQNIHWRVAINSINTLMTNYATMKKQVIQYYSLENEPITIDERW